MNPDWVSRVQRLEAEVAGLRRSLRSRGLIEQAKGVLAERLGVDVEEAFRHLVRTSQRTHVRVVDVAADVMATDRPEDGPDEQLRSTARVRAAAAATEDPGDLVAIVHEGVAVLGARAVAVHLARPEGGHVLLAAHGWPAQVVSDWRHVPSAVRTPAAEALRRNEMLWLPEPSGPPLFVIGAGEHRTVVPLTFDVSMPGPTAAVEFVWSQHVPPDERTLALLRGVTEAVGGWLLMNRHRWESIGGSDGYAWIAAAADAALTPALVFSPLTDGSGRIVDFVVEHINQPAAATWAGRGGSPVGRRLLDLEPDLAAAGAVTQYAEAYQGEPRSCLAPDGGPPGRAARVGRGLVVTWPGEASASTGRLEAIERLGDFGWAEWSQQREPVVWSPGLDRLLGRPHAGRPLPLDRLLKLVWDDDDRAALEAVVQRAGDGPQAPAVVRVRTAAGPRHLTVVSGPGGDGRRTLTLFQDITEAREREAEAARVAQRLAATRIQTAVERATAHELRAALFPVPESRHSHRGWHVAARHVADNSINRFRGDFYEIMPAGPGLVLVVGDVFGSGVAAASAMIRIRHAARALTLAGEGPARTLELINQELAGDVTPPLASALIAHLRAATVTWAQAGHYSPVLLRDGQGRSLARPRGDAFGLIPDTRYTESSAGLAPGDVLVLFTDGVLNRGDGRVTAPRELASALADASAGEGAEGIVRRFPRPAGDEACVVAAEWRGERTR